MIDPIQIGPLTFTVEVLSEVRDDNDRRLYGQIKFSDQKIQLEQQYDDNPQRRQLILWHEVLHGILEVSGLDTKLSISEEEFVKTFTYHLVDVINRNQTWKWGE